MSRIASIGWGSLIWDPREFPLRSPWFNDGPQLPVEFTRQALDGRITLVIEDAAAPIPTLWALLDVGDITGAREALRRRERIPEHQSHHVGSFDAASGTPPPFHGIGQWMQQRDLDAVVWTALPSRFSGEFRTPSIEEVIAYLQGLQGEVRRRAERYIRRAPLQTDTPYRRRIEAELGWIRRPPESPDE